MNLYFVDRADTINEVKNRLNAGDIILVRYWEPISYLKEKNIPFINFEKEITHEEGEFINEKVHDFLENWYKNDSKDLTEIDGISYGFVIEYSLIFPVIYLIKLAMIFNKLLNKFNPKHIFYDYSESSFEGQILIKIADMRKVDYNSIGYSDKKANKYEPFFYNNLIINKGLKATLKKYLFKTISTVNDLFFKSKKKQKAIFTFFTPQIIDFTNLYYNRFKDLRILIGSNNLPPISFINNKLRNNLQYYEIPLSDKTKKENYIKLKAGISENIRSYNFKKLCLIDGIDLSDIFAEIIFNTIKSFPILIGYKDYYQRLFKEQNVKLILSPNDCTPLRRLIVLIGKKIDIKSIIIQHGVLGWRFDKNHLLGDYSAVWGEEVRTRLIQEGLSKEQVFLTGFLPRMKKSKTRLKKRNNKKKILILTTNSPMGYNSYSYEFIQVTMKALSTFGNINIKIKIHPAESVDDYRRYIRGYHAQIYKTIDLDKIICWSDIVITSGSTATINSLLAGKFVACFSRFKCQNKFKTFWNDFVEIHEFYNENSLRIIINKLLTGEKLNRKENGNISFRDYIGYDNCFDPLPKELLNSLM